MKPFTVVFHAYDTDWALVMAKSIDDVHAYYKDRPYQEIGLIMEGHPIFITEKEDTPAIIIIE